MKDPKKMCKECPFKRNSLPGYLGSYSSPEEFITVHRDLDEQSPCHSHVDYESPGWRGRLNDGPGCRGQQIFYKNECKRPRGWKLAPDVAADIERVFQWRQEFLDHHNRKP